MSKKVKTGIIAAMMLPMAALAKAEKPLTDSVHSKHVAAKKTSRSGNVASHNSKKTTSKTSSGAAKKVATGVSGHSGDTEAKTAADANKKAADVNKNASDANKTAASGKAAATGKTVAAGKTAATDKTEATGKTAASHSHHTSHSSIASKSGTSKSATTKKNTNKNATAKKKKGSDDKVQYGVASYYANKFEGRKTYTDEIFTQEKLTGASNTLPMGTWVKVTNLRNDRTVYVRINDKMHPKNRRLIDLSRSAAKQLGYAGRGLTRVRLDVMGRKRPAEAGEEMAAVEMSDSAHVASSQSVTTN